jgi:hypothetical protein
MATPTTHFLLRALPIPACKITAARERKSTPGAVRATFLMCSALQTDDIYMMRSPGRMLDDVANWELTLIDQTNYWPNDPNYMPSE